MIPGLKNLKKKNQSAFVSSFNSGANEIFNQNTTGRKSIIFHGAGGGVGTTTLAGEAAIYMAAAGYKTVALDLNLFRGSLHYKLDVPISQDIYTISDLIPVIDDLDDRIVENALSKSPFGPLILPAPFSSLEAGSVQPSHVRKLLSFISERFQRVVVDTSPIFNDLNRGICELGDVVVLTIAPELSCIGGARRFLEELELCCNPLPETNIVLNRTIKGSDPFSIGEIQSFLGRSIFSVIPEETSICRQLSCQGRQIVRSKTGVGQSFEHAIQCLSR